MTDGLMINHDPHRPGRLTILAALALLLPLFLLGGSAPAGAQGASGAIFGVITDPQSGVLPGVSVSVRNLETGLLRTVVTEGDGRYRLAGLPPGHYQIAAELQGFSPAGINDAALAIGSELQHDFRLTIGGVQESLTVVG